MLKLTNVSKEYGIEDNRVRVLDNITLSVGQGEFVAVTGASGAGKSTLLNVMSTIDNVTEGQIEYHGTRIDSLSQEKAAELRLNQFGFVFQKYYLLSTLNIYDNILLPITMSAQKIDSQYFQSLINILGLEDQLSKMPGKLSGGEQQRVAIARALIHRPEIIFADEPTGNLDSHNGGRVFELLLECSAKYGQTVIFVTHNEDFADRAERKIVLKDGAVIEDKKC